jgi:hypothetical protein
MGFREWGVLVFFSVAVLIGWVTMPWYWRGRFSRLLELGFKGVPFSRATMLGWRRAHPASVLFFTCLMPVYADDVLLGRVFGHQPSGVESAAQHVLLILGGVFFLAWVSIVLFNQPKFLVAPVYRHEQGSMAMNRAERAKERARR